MTIAHIIHSIDPLGGGPPVVIVRLAAECAQQGHEVHVISFAQPEAQQRIDAMVHSVPGGDRIRFHQLPAPSRIERVMGNQMREGLGKLLEGIQIVHLHGVWYPIVRAAAQVAYSRQIPYVLTPHGMLDPWAMAQKRWKKKLGLALGYRKMLNRAAVLHLLNRDEADLLKPLRLTSKTTIIPNGISPEEFSSLPVAGTFRKAHPELGSAPYILFLSRLHHKKGLDILADAFAILAKHNSSIHLVIAGADEGALSGFQSQIQTAGLQKRVHVVGPIFGADKLAALVDSACFCLPSRQEGFSIAILEALACAVPVVITDACHFPEVAEVGAGEVVPLNPANVAAALEKVLTNPGSMGIAGQKMVNERFTWPIVAKLMIAEYERYCAQCYRHGDAFR